MILAMLRRIAAFLAGVLTAYVLAAFVSTQMVLNAVDRLGVPVDAATRASAVLHDLSGMAPLYAPMVALVFLIALPVAALAMRFVPGPRTLGYVLAGAVGLAALHLILPAVLGMHPLPATRSLIGLGWQAAAGATGGYVFARLSRPR